MKLAILQNSDMMEKNGFQIRTPLPEIVWKQVVLFQDKNLVTFVDLCYFIPAFGENKLATSIDKRGIHYKDFLPIDVAGILSPNSKK